MTSTTKTPAAKKAPAKKTTATKRTTTRRSAPPIVTDVVEAVEKQVAAERELNPTGAETDPVLRIKAANEEAKAVKAWRLAGEKGKRPATPNIDAIELKQPSVLPNGSKRSAPKTKRADARPMTYLRNGKPMPISANKFSCLAYQCTKGIKSTDSPRMSTAELSALLAKAGVKAPTTTEWSVELPNGVTIGAQFAGKQAAEARAAKAS